MELVRYFMTFRNWEKKKLFYF